MGQHRLGGVHVEENEEEEEEQQQVEACDFVYRPLVLEIINQGPPLRIIHLDHARAHHTRRHPHRRLRPPPSTSAPPRATNRVRVGPRADEPPLTGGAAPAARRGALAPRRGDVAVVAR